MESKKRLLTLFCACSLAFVARTTGVQADEKQTPRWTPITHTDYLSIGLLAAGTVGFTVLAPNSPSGWTNGLLYDDPVRNALRIGSRSGRDAAASLSNLGLGLGIATPFLLDSLGLAWARDHDGAQAWRIAMIDLQAFATAAFLVQSTKVIVGRGRPYLKECTADPGYDDGCTSSDAYMSFFSGHTAMVFTGASLICVSHDKLSLFGNAWADKAACASAMSVAVTTGLLRIAADRHYATDVTVGALVGLFSGWFIPSHFHEVESTSPKEIQGQLMLLPAQDGALAVTEMIRF